MNVTVGANMTAGDVQNALDSVDANLRVNVSSSSDTLCPASATGHTDITYLRSPQSGLGGNVSPLRVTHSKTSVWALEISLETLRDGAAPLNGYFTLELANQLSSQISVNCSALNMQMAIRSMMPSSTLIWREISRISR